MGVGKARALRVAVLNSGPQTASLASESISGTGFGFRDNNVFPGGGDCSTNLAAYSECYLYLKFQPGSATTYNESMTLTYNDINGSHSAGLSLQGVGTNDAVLKITDYQPSYYQDYALAPDSPAGFDFGSRGSATPHTFWLSNVGGTPASSISFSTLASPFSRATGGTCPAGSFSLAPATSCSVVVTFNGASTGTAFLTANYLYNGISTTTESRGVSGTAISGGYLAIYDHQDDDDSGLNIGPVFLFDTVGINGSSVHDFVLINVGSASITNLYVPTPLSPMEYVAMGAGNSSEEDAPYCTIPNGSLLPGQKCAIRMRFHPSSAGAFTGSFTVNSSSNVANRGFQGVAVSNALLRIDVVNSDQNGLRADFGIQPDGSTTVRSLKITNVGSVSATGLAFQLPVSASSAYSINAGTCGGSLSSGSSCEVPVQFLPTATLSAGNPAYSGLFEVDYQDGAQSASSFKSLSGIGTSQAIVSISSCESNCAGGSGGGGGDIPSDKWGSYKPTDIPSRFYFIQNRGIGAVTPSDAMTLADGFYFSGGFPGGSGTVTPYSGGGTYPYCGGTLGQNGVCVVQVSFTHSTTGPHSGDLRINLPGAIVDHLDYLLKTDVTNLAILSISDWEFGGGSGNPFDFGVLGYYPSSFADHIFYIRNTGSMTTSLYNSSWIPGFGASSGSGSFDFTGHSYPGGVGMRGSQLDIPPCGAFLDYLAGSNTCWISVSFFPSSTGTASGSLTFNLDSATSAGSTMTRDFTALSDSASRLVITDDGQRTSSSASNPTFDFGAMGAGSNAQKAFYVFNLGNAPVSTMTFQINDTLAPYSQLTSSPTDWTGLPDCSSGTNLNPGQGCRMTIQFSPVSSGSWTTFFTAAGSGGSPSQTRYFSGSSP